MRNKGTPREILRKRPKNNNKAGIKLSEAISSIWEIAGKNLSVPHSQQDWWKPVPSHQGHIQPATWLTGKFPRLTLLANLGVVIGQISALQWGQWWEGLIENWVWRKGERAKFTSSVGEGKKRFWQIEHIRIPAILDSKSPQAPWIACFPVTLCSRSAYFSQFSQPAKICLKNRHFEEQIHCLPLEEDKNGHEIWSVCRVDD